MKKRLLLIMLSAMLVFSSACAAADDDDDRRSSRKDRTESSREYRDNMEERDTTNPLAGLFGGKNDTAVNENSASVSKEEELPVAEDLGAETYNDEYAYDYGYDDDYSYGDYGYDDYSYGDYDNYGYGGGLDYGDYSDGYGGYYCDYGTYFKEDSDGNFIAYLNVYNSNGAMCAEFGIYDSNHDCHYGYMYADAKDSFGDASRNTEVEMTIVDDGWYDFYFSDDWMEGGTLKVIVYWPEEKAFYEFKTKEGKTYSYTLYSDR